jgi:DHA2 family multidrug resistance protein
LVGMVIMVRSFPAPGIFSGLYSYVLYAGWNRGICRYYNFIQQQAHLSALKEISGNIIIFGLTVIILLSVVWIYGKLRKRLIPA